MSNKRHINIKKMVPWQSSFPLQAHRICPSIRKVGGVFALKMGGGCEQYKWNCHFEKKRRYREEGRIIPFQFSGDKEHLSLESVPYGKLKNPIKKQNKGANNTKNG
jgi:hypothetical protein